MTCERLLYIDESLSKRLAQYLRERGRNAAAASELGYLELKDEPVLRQVYANHGDVVFVTADDGLPGEHGGVCREVRATVATVAPFYAGSWTTYQRSSNDEEAWKREIIHRWAHKMQEQESGTSKRYFLSGGLKWTPKPRRRR